VSREEVVRKHTEAVRVMEARGVKHPGRDKLDRTTDEDFVRSCEGGPGSGHHGHAGRPGHVGGSVSGAGSYGIGAPGSAPYLSDERINSMFVKGLEKGWSWLDSTKEEREQVKHDIVTELSEKSGLSYDEVNEFVAQWAQSSSDEDMRSLGIQESTTKEFGVPMSQFIKERIGAMPQAREQAEKGLAFKKKLGFSVELDPKYNRLMDSNQERKILRTMYNSTQEWFGQSGFSPTDTVRVYRGIQSDKAFDYTVGQSTTAKGNPLESWSFDFGVAERFARGYPSSGGSPYLRGAVMSMNVPVNRIVSSGRTGFGCMAEGELVLLGSTGDNVEIALLHSP